MFKPICDFAELETLGGIYLISGVIEGSPPSVEGSLAYIGMTHRPLVDRLEEHLYKLSKGKHSNQNLQSHYNVYGRDLTVTGAVILCPDYYLNTLEKSYIDTFNTYQKYNPMGWNKSRGGEGAKNYPIPFAFNSGERVIYGDRLRPFLAQNKHLDPGALMNLMEGKTDSYSGLTLARPVRQ